MTSTAPLHFFKVSRARIKARVSLDRLAEEVSENEGMAEHPAKGSDPIMWEKGRIRRFGGAWHYCAAEASGPGYPAKRYPWSS
ncbi:hypothetical protein [Asticcacaulis sp. AC402]|uniref:hypothetical protein n=1 Tax=Asticcacaulis sp. AC402 TaxID=1282361 RepID=UPI0003C3E408|nr:hypothetical protein [Asticcacaulis sp. AC402]ESQ76679.1 hypothetical protein ABAC402_03110 [Asticcacaulis sp. AC402]